MTLVFEKSIIGQKSKKEERGCFMRKYLISTDSTEDLPKEFLKEHNVMIHPLNYILKGVEYGANLTELSSEEFYKIMREGEMPTTSASNPGYISKIMSDKAKEGYDILHISFSSAMSSSYNNACICAEAVMEEVPESKIIVVDSLAASSGQGIIVEHAVRMMESGKTIEEVRDWIEENKLRVIHSFTVEDLFHLMRGGRLSRGTAVVGTVLQVKPVLHVDSKGRLENIGKVRGRKKSLNSLIDTFFENLDETYEGPVIITDADSNQDAEYILKAVREKYPDKEILRSSIGPTIGAHSGPGTMLISYMGKTPRQEKGMNGENNGN